MLQFNGENMRKLLMNITCVFILLVIAVVTYYCVTYIIKSNTVSTRSLDDDFGYGLYLYDDLNDVHNNYVIEVEDSNIKKYLKFINNAKDSKFSLAIYLDYEQIPFLVDGEMLKNYTFELEKYKNKNIPIEIENKYFQMKNSQLTFSIIAGENTYAKDLENSSSFYGISSRYNIRATKENKKDSKSARIDNDLQYFKADFNGILINQDESEMLHTALPPLEIRVKKEQKIPLIIRAGGNSEVNDYLAWLTLGMKQIKINNNEKFINFSAPKSQLIYKKIYITAPSKSGNYEVIGYLVSNPWKSLDDGFPKPIGIDNSYRFTLHVE